MYRVRGVSKVDVEGRRFIRGKDGRYKEMGCGEEAGNER